MHKVESGINPEYNKEMQTAHEKKVIASLIKLFGVDDAGGLKNKMQQGTDLERSILKTSIQGNRPIKSVEEIVEARNVKVDNGKNAETINIPEGTLKIEYGKREDDVADLIVYVWKNENGIVQYRISAEKVNYDKVLENATRHESSSGPNYIADGHVNQPSLGASSPLPESDKRIDSGTKRPSYM
jgi:hypothetical protein